MATVKLLRVERGGKGMYHSSLWSDLYLPTEYDKHPAPYEDSMIFEWWVDKPSSETHFAFGSPQQFLRWVYDPEWRYKMQELGGKLWVYEIESDGCIIGEKQAIFNNNSVVSKRSFPITSFDEVSLRPAIEEYLK